MNYNLGIQLKIMLFPVEEAQISPKQQISNSILLLLGMGTITSFCICGSVYMKYIMLHCAVLCEFFNYCRTSLV